MSTPETAFLAFYLQGGNPQALFETVAQQHQEEFEQEVTQTVEALGNSQAVFEQQANAVINQVVKLDLMTPQEERLRALQQQAKTLEAIQQGLQQSMAEKNAILPQQCQQLAQSQHTLQRLNQQVSRLPSTSGGPLEGAIGEFGERFTAYLRDERYT